MSIRVSVVIPAYNAEELLADCLRALAHQSLGREDFEVIVVDDGSRDGTRGVAESFGVRLGTLDHAGAPAARNAGAELARGDWLAFTDADCIPSRQWLRALLEAIDDSCMGAAGRLLGHASETEAARFVDMSGGLDAERHLSHPKFPFAPLGNALYDRKTFHAAGGFDERFATYDACDFHMRARQTHDGNFPFVPNAVVLHRHRRSWGDYWRQQFGYGRGYGQFLWKHRDKTQWDLSQELRSLAHLVEDAARLLRAPDEESSLIAKGALIKNTAQRLGSIASFWNPTERARW